ncbi:hypothetical protein [Paraburkholderia sp. BL10I2N1]|uniref:hypothetical protein n=1 Tax=Paraburkholderia sp. BL10I2N1 TaxID=1938796 RepID=UPI001061E7E9|nr:hypothetical protein [Paraburkholderia sp. BL10I2N1]TDN70469.1 hypothetical protein B0G77_3943 [Paraburkholderia sp. BL10I2N1]
MGTISEKLLDEYRNINVEHEEWWGCVYSDWIEKLAEKGITTSADQMQFSGFWSQGDGASFTGHINLQRFMEVHALVDEYPGPYHFAKRDEVIADLVRSRSSHYCHEQTVHAELDDDCQVDWRAAEEGELRAVVDAAMFDQYEESDDGLTDDIDRICRGYMQEFYRELEKEHDYLTSDEAVREWLEINEIFDDEDEEDEEEVTGVVEA